MASKREKRFTIRMFPWRAGLATAGQRTSIPEDQLWEATNVTSMLDGLLGKRPGTTQWGQTLKIPDSDDTGSTVTSFIAFLSGINGFVSTDSSTGKILQDVTQDGFLKTSVASSITPATFNYTLSHAVGAQSAGSDWSLRFVFSGTNLPPYTADATDPNTFVFRAQGVAGTGKEFAIHSEGIHYKNNADSKYILVAGTTKPGEGAWTTIEVRVDDAAGNTLVFIDDVLVDTISSALIKDVTPTGTTDVEFFWAVEGSGSVAKQYNTSLATVMFNDSTAAPFKVVTIDGIEEFQYVTANGSSKSALLVAAGNYLYVDNGLKNVWVPLRLRQNRTIFFTRYRNTIIWIDTDGAQKSNVYQWDGSSDPELLDDVPPIQFADEHQQRLIAAGDPLNPLRAYYSAGRKPNVFFSPSPTNTEDQFDALFEAGYVEVPSGEGDEITAIWGDFYGMAIIWTKKGVWKWSGYGPTSFRVDRIVGVDSGCEGPNNVTQVGNDLWFLGRQGLQSLAATDKFGDLQTQFPSAPIQDLWTQNPTSVKRISTHFLSRARLTYNPPQGLVYMAVPTTGQTEPNSVYVFNVNTQVWLGPWEINSRAMSNVEIGIPRIEVIMHGATEGIVHYTDQSRHDDATGGAVAMTLASSFLNGRSIPNIGPQILGMRKTWKTLRLYVLPRGKWDFTVDAETDSQNQMDQQTIDQNINKVRVLTDDWKIGDNPDGRLRSLEEMGIREISLDLTGINMNFTLKQPNAGENFIIQGAEVDFVVGGYEEE